MATFTYNFLASPATALDQVRSLIGDTDSTAPLMVDSEIIDYLARVSQNAYRAAILCCQAIAGKYSRRADITAYDISKKNSQVAKAYRDLAKELTTQLALLGVSPLAGGIRKSDKDVRVEDADRVEPSFTRRTGAPTESNIGIVNDQQVTQN